MIYRQKSNIFVFYITENNYSISPLNANVYISHDITFLSFEQLSSMGIDATPS